MSSNKKTARLVGWLYLIYLATQITSDTFVRGRLIVWGDAAATAREIASHAMLFRIGFVGDLLSAAFFLLAAWGLYVLLEPVNRKLALLFLLLNLAGVAIQGTNALSLMAAMLLSRGESYMAVFQAGQLQALAMFFVNLHKNGFMAAQIFYGTWLLPLGTLVYKSRFLPRFLGILLVLDSFGVLIWFLQFFLFPGYEVITYPGLAVSFIAELSLALWLSIRGTQEWAPAGVGAG